MTRSFVDVHFEGGRADGVTEAQIHQGEFEHERAVLMVERAKATSKRFKSGAPVRIDWGYLPKRKRTFYGYINHVEPIENPAAELRGDQLLKVVCVGPTWVFKDGGYLTYRNMTAPLMIKKIAEEMRFDTRHIKPHSKVWPVEHQGGRSQWEFMVHCARQIGWTLFARGLELHCLDRQTAVTQSQSSAPILIPAIAGGHVQRLKSSLGAASPTGGDLRVRDAYGINPRTGNVLARRNKADSDRPMFRAAALAPSFGTSVVDMPFESLGEVESKLSAAESLNRMPIEAHLEGASDPRVSVGRTVYVAGMNEADNGHWYVRSAVHKIRGLNDTSMTLKLGRDTESQLTSVVPVGVAPPVPRGARLVNRQWVLG